MKILILGFAKIAYMPYLNFYLEALADTKAEVHVVTWKRDQEKDVPLQGENIFVHEFCCDQRDEVLKVSKLGNFARYRRFVIRLLEQECFEKIIALHTFPAVLLSDKLLTVYSERFVFDYRDYTYERFYPFKKLIAALVKKSFATFVSSDAFRDTLPKLDKIYTSHNILMDSLEYRNARCAQERNRKPIRISFWGFIRHEKINVSLMEHLGGDSRFELHYYGREQKTADNLKELVAKNDYQNVFFHGAYLPKDRYTFAAQTDLLHNMYENDEQTQKAMGNKYYDGIVFKIPQLCTIGSFMGNLITKEGTGLALDPASEHLGDQIEQYYTAMDWAGFENACDAALAKILDEYREGRNKILEFCTDTVVGRKNCI